MTIATSVENRFLQIDLANGRAELIQATAIRDGATLLGSVDIQPWKACALADVQAQVDALVTAVLAHAPAAGPLSIAQLVAYAANRRWRKETGGASVDFGGTLGVKLVMSDDRSKVMIIGAASSASQNAAYSTDWKFADGSFATLDAAAIATMAGTVGAHVASCFATEQTVVVGILADPPTVTTAAEIDTAFA